LKLATLRLILLGKRAKILAELPKLSREERRRVAAAIFDLEEEADLLRDCDRRADERFRMLDVMEEQDAQTGEHSFPPFRSVRFAPEKI